MKTYKLYLLRHGITKANLDGAYCGSTDLPLCPEGEQNLYDILAEYSYPYADVVYTSPLLRAKQTASILYPEAEPIELADLREASFGRFEGKTMRELRGDPEYDRWVTPGSKFLPAGLEDPKAFYERCCAAFRHIVEEMMQSGLHTAAVITHAGVIGNMLAQYAYPKKAPYDWQSAAGCGYKVLIDPTLYMRDPVAEVVDTIPEYVDLARGGSRPEDDEDGAPE